MPQPLRKLPSELKYGPDALTARPTLAIQIARIGALWAGIETEIGLILASALDTQAGTGVAMYLSLTGSVAQEHVLSAAINRSLPQEMKEQFEDLLGQVRARAKERNKVVHCLWGVSPDFTDSLIHCSPDNWVRDIVEVYTMARLTGAPLTPSDDYVAGLSRYTAGDFTNIEKRILDLNAKLRDFGRAASHHNEKQHALSHALMHPVAVPSKQAPPDKRRTNPEEPA